MAPVSTLGPQATPIKRGIGNAIVPFAPTGQRIPAQGIRPGNHIPENRCVLKEHRIGKAGVEVRDTEAMRRSFRTRSCFAGWVPRVGTLGWYAMPRQGMGFETGLGHGIGNGSTLRENGIEPDKKRSAPRPESATHGYRRSAYETTTQAAKPPL